MKKESAVIRKLSTRAAAVATAVALTAACGSGSSGASVTGPGFDLASKQVLNPAPKTGGVIDLTYGASFDSIDPGVTYSGPTWNLYRTFARPMLSYQHTPGGTQLVGDLATGLGQHSADGLTWTYTLREGATYENGTPIVAKDVKWAIERANWSSLVGNGPNYFTNILTPFDKSDPTTKKFEKFQTLNVYKSGDADFAQIIETPNDHTIVFHLPHPFGEFDYVMSLLQTAPVPYKSDAADSGDAYGKKPLATGAYKIASFDNGKELKLVRNDAYNANSDPEKMHVAYADTIDIQMGIDASERDQRLLTGQADADIGAALTVANHAKVLQDPALKSQVDDSTDNSVTYSSINVQVVTNLDCRKAIEYAVDKDTVLNQLGGEWGGVKAGNLLPPAIPGAQTFDTYQYDPNQAKSELAKCKQSSPGLFESDGSLSFKLAAQTNNPDQQNVATAIQASLKDIGINAEIKLYPFGQYSQYCGNPDYAKAHRLGMCLGTWIADWLTGYGMLDQWITEHGIAPTGSSNWSFFADKQMLTFENQALNSADPAVQQSYWVKMDHLAMDQATMVPLVFRKVMRFRSAKLANVMINPAGSGAYDLSVLGLK